MHWAWAPPFGWGGGAHSLAGEGVGESQFRRGDVHCGVLLYMYVLCGFQGIPAGRLQAGAEVRGRPGLEKGGNSCATDGEAAVR